MAYAAINEYTQAIADYTQAIELEPTYTKAYVNRGSVYVTTRQYESAIVDCNKAIELEPNTEEAYHNRGLAIGYTLQDYSQALADLSIAIGLNPNEARSYVNRALLYIGGNRCFDAWRDIHYAEEFGYQINPKLYHILQQHCPQK